MRPSLDPSGEPGDVEKEDQRKRHARIPRRGQRGGWHGHGKANMDFYYIQIYTRNVRPSIGPPFGTAA